MSKFGSENIEIAALKKKRQEIFDPMIPGTGTPWEDRGTHGLVGALFKTSIASMFSPGKLMAKIRRPETTNDARLLLIVYSVIWAFSAAVHCWIVIYNHAHTPPPTGFDQDIDWQTGYILCGISAVFAGLGAFFLFSIYNKIFGLLAAQEKGTALMPDVLLYNVNVYALGPTLLALIPFIGPPIAILWIFIGLVIAGSSRLRLRFAGAVIDALLGWLAVVGIVIFTFVIGEIVILDHLLDYDAVTVTKHVDPNAR